MKHTVTRGADPVRVLHRSAVDNSAALCPLSEGRRNRSKALSELIEPLRRTFDSLASSPHRYRGKDGLIFFKLVSEFVHQGSIVVDFGAGRGRQPELYQEGRFQGRCAKVIGLDVDPVVLQNPYCDEAHVIKIGSRLPLEDGSVDVLYAYAVLEHVANPDEVAAEIRRVLKPGGWFCAWTPSKWGYVGAAVRLIPNRLHAVLLRVVNPDASGFQRRDEDVFPTLYRMNTRRALRACLPEFLDASFYANGDPSYHFGLVAVKNFWSGMMALAPAPMRKALFVFMQKPTSLPS